MAVGLAGVVLHAVAEQKRPNILFILADDNAMESIAAYGSWLKDYTHTPNLDRLAKEGMLFRNMCCNDSICSPSRASIMTGQYNHVNHVLGNAGTPINPESPWLSKELKAGGYQTWLVGKWHLEPLPQGFDDFRVVKGQGTYFDPKYIGPDGLKEQVEGYSSDKYADKAMEWLDGRDRDKPFCMMLHFKATHHEFDPAPRHMKLLEGVKVPEPPSLYEDPWNAKSRLKQDWAERTKFHLVYAPKNGDPENPKTSYYNRHRKEMEPHDKNDMDDRRRVAYQHMIKQYIRCLAGIDENVGRMIDYLKKEGILNDTIIVYTADQGYWLGQHGFYDKRLILDGSLKMPFIVRYPKLIRPASENQDLCSNVDIAPTLLDLVNLPVPPTMQGRSMAPLLKGQTPSDWRKAVWYNYPGKPQHYGIRTDRYTLVHDHDSDAIELYDIQRDPTQSVSLHDQPEYKETIRKLEKELVDVMAEVDITHDQLKEMRGAGGDDKGD